MYSILKRFVEY